MDHRRSKAASRTLVPVRIAGLGDLHLQTFGRLLDISRSGLRLGVLEAVPVGSLLQLELEGWVIRGEVRYCQDQKTWYAIGLEIRDNDPFPRFSD